MPHPVLTTGWGIFFAFTGLPGYELVRSAPAVHEHVRLAVPRPQGESRKRRPILRGVRTFPVVPYDPRLFRYRLRRLQDQLRHSIIQVVNPGIGPVNRLVHFVQIIFRHILTHVRPLLVKSCRMLTVLTVHFPSREPCRPRQMDRKPPQLVMHRWKPRHPVPATGAIIAGIIHNRH